MADWKSKVLINLVITEDMVDYVMEKYGNKWLLDDDVGHEILDDELKREFEKQQRLKERIILDSDTSLSSESLERSSFSDIPPSTNAFQTSSDNACDSSSEDTFDSDDTWEQKKTIKKDTSKSKNTAPCKLLKFYDDSTSDDQKTLFKGKPGKSSIFLKEEKVQSQKRFMLQFYQYRPM
ncbi:hypothetical protein Tco_1210263 [Tanacetum coccineum]